MPKINRGLSHFRRSELHRFKVGDLVRFRIRVTWLYQSSALTSSQTSSLHTVDWRLLML